MQLHLAGEREEAMSQTPTPGFDNEPEDWWPSEVSEEGAGESPELEGQPPGPVEGRGDRGEADGGAGGIPVGAAPFDEDERPADAAGRGLGS